MTGRTYSLPLGLGAESGSVTDIYLPDWFARNIPAIHAPLLVLMTYLHVKEPGTETGGPWSRLVRCSGSPRRSGLISRDGKEARTQSGPAADGASGPSRWRGVLGERVRERLGQVVLQHGCDEPGHLGSGERG